MGGMRDQPCQGRVVKWDPSLHLLLKPEEKRPKHALEEPYRSFSMAIGLWVVGNGSLIAGSDSLRVLENFDDFVHYAGNCWFIVPPNDDPGVA